MTPDVPIPFTVRQIGMVTEGDIRGLGDVLIDCVEGGASVSFMWPMTRGKADAFWSKVAGDVETGQRLLFVAEDASGIIGTVQVVYAQSENQPHRADISKMLVHQRARRRGVGAVLMQAAEVAARAAGKSVLMLDTASDDAERLYVRMGWTLAGVVPDYALLPDGRLCATSLYYRRI